MNSKLNLEQRQRVRGCSRILIACRRRREAENVEKTARFVGVDIQNLAAT
jgi:hypothetical protein